MDSSPQETVTQPEPDERPIRERLTTHGYVAVGPGADACAQEQEQRGSCDDPEHFHAWCRLPNPYQHREIRKKAMAAKARLMRRLRDPQCDEHDTLEEEMDTLLRIGRKDSLVDELVRRDAYQDVMSATQEVKDDEPERWASADEDIARLQELEQQPEDERDDDEFEELQRHTKAYWEAVTESVRERQEPYRQALEQKDLSDLVDMIRTERIEALGTEEFMHVYGMWSHFLCTLTPDRKQRKFSDVSLLTTAPDAAPAEVVTAIKGMFDALERGFPKG